VKGLLWVDEHPHPALPGWLQRHADHRRAFELEVHTHYVEFLNHGRGGESTGVDSHVEPSGEAECPFRGFSGSCYN